MRRSIARNWAGLLLSVCLTVISACGGGGGGSSGSNTSTAPPEPSTTGLMPAAPVVGATLTADARELRPLQDNAKLFYHGVLPGTYAPAGYTNEVRQVADGNGVREESTNLYNTGADPGLPVQVDGGVVRQRDTLQVLEGGPVEQLDVVELRSPVRLNDRYVMLDKRYDDAGTDFDGDRIRDALEVAFWAQVVGEETVDLPNRAAVRAVRVDTTLRMRVQYSSDKSYSPVTELIRSVWYAAGIGVVKSRVDAPTTAGSQFRKITEESLVSWDAGDRGLGPTKAVAQVAPAGSRIAGSALLGAIGVAAFERHAVVMSYIPGAPMAEGFTLTHLDERGLARATAVYRYADFPGLAGGAGPRLVRVGSEVRVLFFSATGLRMASFDTTGQNSTAASSVVLTQDSLWSMTDTSTFQVAAAGSDLWLAWTTYPIESNGQYRSKLKLQRFNASGLALEAPTVLEDSIDPRRLGPIRMAGSAARMVVSWVRFDESSTGPTWRYALASAQTGAAIAQRTLERVSATPLCQADFSPQLLDSRVVFTCMNYPTSDGATVLNSDLSVMLGADGSVVVGPVIPESWGRTMSRPVFGFDADRLLVDAGRSEKYWPEDAMESSVGRIGELPLVAGSLNASSMRLLARFNRIDLQPVAFVPMSDRLVVIGTDCLCQDGKLRTMIVWR